MHVCLNRARVELESIWKSDTKLNLSWKAKGTAELNLYIAKEFVKHSAFS